MPSGKTWSKTLRKWIDKDTTRDIDYEKFDEDAWSLLVSFWRQYPDYLLDILEAEHPLYKLELIQRVMIRSFCRYSECFVTGSRGLTKTFCILIANMLLGILYPGIHRRYIAPSMRQAAEIISAVYKQVQAQYPGLAKHWRVLSDSQERFEIETDYGSTFSVYLPRGGTAHGVVLEECAQEDDGDSFNHVRYQSVIAPAIRADRKIDGDIDKVYPAIQHLYITSAGRMQNESFEYRKSVKNEMVARGNAFCMDVPSEVAVLSNIRNWKWRDGLKKTLTPDEWMRQMDSIWTGAAANPIIRDEVLQESKTLQVMENRHNADPKSQYIIGYDVSYRDGSRNARCATVIVRAEEQKGNRADRYMKNVVYVLDTPPPKESVEQALRLKKIWAAYSLDNGKPTYIAIDSNSYGQSVLEDLHKDLGDGLPPLCCMNHEMRELEREGALPVIYPIRATGGFLGLHDPDVEMLRYAELEFEHRNVALLTTNIYEGVKQYKAKHRIKGDDQNRAIAIPYEYTKKLCGQISNLQKRVSGTGMREERISKSVQRDDWSALKYALRLCQILERKNTVNSLSRKGEWDKYADSYMKQASYRSATRAKTSGRIGGNARH